MSDGDQTCLPSGFFQWSRTYGEETNLPYQWLEAYSNCMVLILIFPLSKTLLVSVKSLSTTITPLQTSISITDLLRHQKLEKRILFCLLQYGTVPSTVVVSFSSQNQLLCMFLQKCFRGRVQNFVVRAGTQGGVSSIYHSSSVQRAF